MRVLLGSVAHHSNAAQPCGLLRGLARSHRDCTALESDAVPVGAGKPAKKPTTIPQTTADSCRLLGNHAPPSSL
ncbi:hypothetical protein C6A77_22150 [Pseudomonas sp. AFG_SD02_1510_Pfu_092]|nr:hypothetical protein C6A77_22150 [Pseudomonas sp. AFG_SD02_1510_Pfu_092]